MEKKGNELTLTKSMLEACKTPMAILDLEQVKAKYVETYKNVTGKQDGELRFEMEKMLFAQTVAESKQLAECDKFSLYSSFIMLAISGLSLKDGQAYIIPYNKKASFMVGWKGRLEQIQEIKNVIHVNEPILIYKGDKVSIKYVDGNLQITEHVPDPFSDCTEIEGVYMRIDFNGFYKLYYMSSKEVLSIRDQYSIPYKQYMKITPSADGKRYRSYGGNTWEVEKPTWISDEGQMFKKTLVKRVYNMLPKTAKQQMIDAQITESALDQGINMESIDEEDINKMESIMDSAVNIESEQEHEQEYTDFVETKTTDTELKDLFGDDIDTDKAF